MMIFKKKLLIIVQVILVLCLESAYAVDIIADKRDLEFEAKELRSYSQEQLLEIISEKIKNQQDLLIESSDSPLIHYISTVYAARINILTPLNAAINCTRQICRKNICLVDRVRGEERVNEIMREMNDFLYEGEWFDAGVELIKSTENFKKKTFFHVYSKVVDIDYVEIESEIENQITSARRSYRFIGKEKVFSTAKKEALVYMAQHGGEVWNSFYKQFKDTIRDIREDIMIEHVLNDPVIFPDELLENKFANFYIKEISKAEENLRTEASY
ncbi:MAG: hypothetical protein AB8G05_28195 [Oligoflexales bacterium]